MGFWNGVGNFFSEIADAIEEQEQSRQRLVEQIQAHNERWGTRLVLGHPKQEACSSGLYRWRSNHDGAASGVYSSQLAPCGRCGGWHLKAALKDAS